MIVTERSTLKSIVDACPEAVEIFARYGIDIYECEGQIVLSESLPAQIKELSALVKELQSAVGSKGC